MESSAERPCDFAGTFVGWWWYDTRREQQSDILERTEELFLEADAIVEEHIHKIMAPTTDRVSCQADESVGHVESELQHNGDVQQPTPTPLPTSGMPQAARLRNFPTASLQLPWQLRIGHIWGGVRQRSKNVASVLQ